MKNPFVILFLIIFFIVALNNIIPQEINYPFSNQDPVIDKYFDTTIIDPYRWLEDDYSPKTKSWVEKQNAVTNRYLRKIPYRKKIEKRLREVWDYPTISIPFKKGNKHYFYQNSGMQNQAVLYVKDSLNGVAKVLLDPNSLSRDGSVALKGIYFSKNNKYMASDCPLAGKHLKQLEADTNISNNEALHPIELMAKSYKL